MMCSLCFTSLPHSHTLSNNGFISFFLLSALATFSDSPKVSIRGEWIRRQLRRAENHGEGRGSITTLLPYPPVRTGFVETCPVPVNIPDSNFGLNLGVSQADVESAEPAWAAVVDDRWT
jgi:hypothetical protein